MQLESPAPVSKARKLMSEAKNWSVFRWLTERSKVRATADTATDALNELELTVKRSWSDDISAAYDAASEESFESPLGSAMLMLKQAEALAAAARLEAEKTFEEAEKRMSLSKAREGTEKALIAWELREKAIEAAASLIEK